jgi:hypothetical protein
MPREVPRLWTDRELVCLRDTVVNLRKMRTAALSRVLPFPVLARNLTAFLQGKELEKRREAQEVLTDARRLTEVAADFLTKRLFKLTPSGQEPEEWTAKLAEYKARYREYPMTTFAKSTLSDVVGNSFIGRLRNLSIDPEYMLEWDLVHNNNLGADSVLGVLQNPPAVISPLSGDYFMAMIYSRYLGFRHGKTFKVEPVILGGDLRKAVLPRTESGQRVFEAESTIAVYVDTTETGRTARALSGHLQGEYGDKTLLHPRGVPLEFVPSRKMKKFWARYR